MAEVSLKLFFSYSHKDETLRDELADHLATLKREGVISSWHDRKILPGQEWDHQINDNLNTADIILLLVSSNFLASDYCWDVEVKKAIERHNAGEACVIPVILRPVDWNGTLFAKLQALPKNAEPVVSKSWHTTDEAFTDVAKGIRAVVEKLKRDREERQQQSQRKREQEAERLKQKQEAESLQRQRQQEETEGLRQQEAKQQEVEKLQRQQEEVKRRLNTIAADEEVPISRYFNPPIEPQTSSLVTRQKFLKLATLGGAGFVTVVVGREMIRLASTDKLRELLEAKDWRGADEETGKMMSLNSGGDWNSKRILNLPCADLHKIDRLWVEYSKGSFGFSVQKEIYLSVGGKLDINQFNDKEYRPKFGDLVGLRVDKKWIEYSKLIFDTSAPRGHLPVGGIWGFNIIYATKDPYFVGLSSLLYRVRTCNT